MEGRDGEIRTADFPLAVVGDGAEHGILLTGQTVCSTIDIVLGAGRVVFGLSCNVLFAARLLPRGGSRDVTNSLDDGALDGVVLASGFAENGSAHEGDGGGARGSVLWLGLRRRIGRHCCSGGD